MGSGSHCRSGPLAGGRIHLLRLQKVLWEKEEAEESAGEEDRPAQERKGRRRRGRREGACPRYSCWDSDPQPGCPDAAVLFVLQEGEVKKTGEEEEKEQEKLGKLEYSLDYNFTDTQVGPGSRRKNTSALF